MTESGTNLTAGELHLDFDRDAGIPMHLQVETGLREAIRSGRLHGDSVLPATRRLADQLGLSRGVVVEAYQQLTAEGYLIAQTGGYTRVARDIVAAPRPIVASPGEPPRAPDGTPLIDFRYGRPDVSQFPRTAWLRTLRTVLTQAPNGRLSYLDGRGAPELRAALADYINRVRGTWATPDDLVACSGFAQALSLTFPVLRARGIRRLAVEDPADADARRSAQAAGLEVIGIPVTPTGIDVDALEASDAQVVLVTPAHQFPIGSVMSPERRTALVAWAKRTGGLIIEDDYDAEYRYDQSPVGAIQGLAPDHVIYAGTTSKTLAPGLRLGWLVAPTELAEAIAQQKVMTDRGSPVIEQLAFAEFLERGEFDRHLRKMRPIYRKRRDAMLTALRTLIPELDPIGIAAGLHVFSWLPPDLDEAAVVASALRHGLILEGAEKYHVAGHGRGGLIFGYGQTDPETIPVGIAALRDAMDEVRAVTPPPAAPVAPAGRPPRAG
jgi:GntR family transcriptional regulator/MocR family aminotransferase